MLIAELRGTIITIRAEILTDNYFDELQRFKKDQKKSLSEILSIKILALVTKILTATTNTKDCSLIQKVN